MDIISRKYINEGFNSKAYIINDDYILLDGVNHNSYKNYQKYVNVINQISNVKSLEIPRIIEFIQPCEEYRNGVLIYKMIKGHTLRKEHIEIVNLDNIAIITNIRHKEIILNAIKETKKAQEVISQNMPIDIIGIYIKDIMEALGKITGESVSDEIIKEIFSKFCLGK